MNDEYKQLGNFALRLLVVVLFGLLYSLGGIEYKFLRRFVAPAILTAGMFWFSRDWKSLITITLTSSLCLGYGGTDLEWLKIAKRTLFATANGITSSGYNLLGRKWLLFVLQLIILISAYIFLGVYSLIDSRGEELVLGVLIALIPMMSARRTA